MSDTNTGELTRESVNDYIKELEGRLAYETEQYMNSPDVGRAGRLNEYNIVTDELLLELRGARLCIKTFDLLEGKEVNFDQTS